MRIIAGSLQGRSFNRPASRSVRPMSDKVRGALFDILGDVSDLAVLDVYAGSGSIGLEAISRGAVRVVGIEANRRVAQVIRDNAMSIGIEAQYDLSIATVHDWLARAADEQFDVVIADPPYAKMDAGELGDLTRILKVGSVLALSHSSRIEAPALQSLEFLQARTYGDSSLSFYRKLR